MLGAAHDIPQMSAGVSCSVVLQIPAHRRPVWYTVRCFRDSAVSFTTLKRARILLSVACVQTFVHDACTFLCREAAQGGCER